MKIVRVVLLAAIAFFAVVVTIAAVSAKTAPMPLVGASENFSSLAAAALADYETNAANTDNVYQQQVVAAWGAKDLLNVVTKQNAQIIDNQDVQIRAQAAQLDNQSNLIALMKALIVMAVLLILAIAVLGITLRDRKRPHDPAPIASSDQGHVAPEQA